MRIPAAGSNRIQGCLFRDEWSCDPIYYRKKVGIVSTQAAENNLIETHDHSDSFNNLLPNSKSQGCQGEFHPRDIILPLKYSSYGLRLSSGPNCIQSSLSRYIQFIFCRAKVSINALAIVQMWIPSLIRPRHLTRRPSVWAVSSEFVRAFVMVDFYEALVSDKVACVQSQYCDGSKTVQQWWSSGTGGTGHGSLPS